MWFALHEGVSRQGRACARVLLHKPGLVSIETTQCFASSELPIPPRRGAIFEQIAASGKALGEALNERALQIHLQRIVGAHVASAYGTAQFYGAKLSAAKDLTTRLGNDDRDEDRGGPSGFEDKAARARRFAAEMALQSYALRAAAEGAVLAYAEVTGDLEGLRSTRTRLHQHQPPRCRCRDGRIPDRLIDPAGGAARLRLFSRSFLTIFIAGRAQRRGGLPYSALSDRGVAYRLIQDCAPRSRRATLCT